MTKDFLKEKTEVKILGDYFPILSPANLIIYLSLHFFHHNFRGIFRLEFLDKIIRRFHLVVWQGETLKVIDYHIQNFVYPVFLLLKKYYRTPLPDSFLNSLKPKLFVFLMRRQG